VASIARPTTIAVEDSSGAFRKITKIIHHSGGGFAVLAPYHRARCGCLLKFPVDYDVKGDSWVPFADCIEYSADDRVKLSFHPDGFVQFSGENPAKIISGRDVDGKPKGLGLISNPLSHPIRSGPTFGVSAWGLEEFDKLETNRDDVIIFSQEEMYFRGCLPGTEDGVHLEAFVLESRYWSGVRRKQSTIKLSLCVGMFEATGAALELSVIPLENSNLIGILASHVRMRLAPESGFTLNGPSESVEGSSKNVLMAVYPGSSMREEIRAHVKVSMNLNYGA